MPDRVTIDITDVERLAANFRKWSNQKFTKREKRRIAGKGVPATRAAVRAMVKRRPKNAPISVFSINGTARFAHKPGNLRASLNRLILKRSYFVWVGAFANSRTASPIGQHTMRDGTSVSLFGPKGGRGSRNAYAPYAYKAYGDAAGSTYSNWNTQLLKPAQKTSSSAALRAMEQETLRTIDIKIQKSGL